VLFLVFGVVEGVLILLAFRMPHITVSVLVVVMAGFVVIDGVTALLEAARATDRRLGLVLRALTGVAAGVLILLLTSGWSVTVFGWWAVVTGVLAAADAVPSGPVRIVVAALSLVLGVLAVGGAFRDPVRATLAISLYGILAGGMQLRAARSGYPGRPDATVG
jgi:hypothetical protein